MSPFTRTVTWAVQSGPTPMSVTLPTGTSLTFTSDCGTRSTTSANSTTSRYGVVAEIGATGQVDAAQAAGQDATAAGEQRGGGGEGGEPQACGAGRHRPPPAGAVSVGSASPGTGAAWPDCSDVMTSDALGSGTAPESTGSSELQVSEMLVGQVRGRAAPERLADQHDGRQAQLVDVRPGVERARRRRCRCWPGWTARPGPRSRISASAFCCFTSTSVTSASLSTLDLSDSRLSRTNPATSPRASDSSETRRGEVAALVGEEACDVRQAPVELAYAAVVRRDRGRERLQFGDRAEEVLAGVREGARQLTEVADRVVEGLAVAVEVLRADVERVGHRALGVGALRAQRVGQLGGGAGEVVDPERHRGAFDRDDGAVGELRPAGVRRRELHVAARHQARRDHHGTGVGGQLEVRVVEPHVDPHPSALRHHRGDGADGHAEDPHGVVLEHRRGGGEVGGDGPARGCEHQVDATGEEDGDDGEQAGELELPAIGELERHGQHPPGLIGPMAGGTRPQM